MKAGKRIIAGVVLALLLGGLPLLSAHGDTSFRVVVNKSNGTPAIDYRNLSDIFLKRTTLWQNKKTIVPVDLVADSHIRNVFSEEVLARPVTAVKMYWQQQLFSGRGIPPPELKGDQEVIDFVSSHEFAIGYVS